MQNNMKNNSMQNKMRNDYEYIYFGGNTKILRERFESSKGDFLFYFEVKVIKNI